MPIYDPIERRLAVRIVYDGVGCAGKTTNLRQLYALFIAQRRSEVETPEELGGRTLWFDWMQIMAGAVCGFPLLCQIVSVPGQLVLTPRRRHLLSTADVIVSVCESTRGSIDGARQGLELYEEMGLGHIPLVIQANKQDRVGALPGVELVKELGRPSAPVVEAIATEGIGVVDTFVTAVRTVARGLTEQADRGQLHLPVRRAETPGEVLARLAEETLDPEAAAEMLLEELQSIYVIEEARVLAAETPESLALAAEEIVAIDTTPPPAPTNHVNEATPVPFPSPDVPTGYIWPAHTGRSIVSSLGLSGSGNTNEDGVITHVARDHVVRTSLRQRFADSEIARQALVRIARECTQLERLLVPDTVLVAQPTEDGACFIWTVRSDLPSVEQLLENRIATRDLLTSYGIAVVEALRTSLRRGFSLDLAPASFGVQQGALRYIGELTPEPPDATRISTSIFAAVSVIERAGADIGAFLEAFERELEKRLTAEERERAPSSGRLYEMLSRSAPVA